TGPGDLKVVPADGGPRTVPLKFWRNGEVRALTVAAGPLGIEFAPGRTAAQVLLARPAAGEALGPPAPGRAGGRAARPAPRGGGPPSAALSPPGRVPTLLGAGATEAAVRAMAPAGELARYRYLHFATHGRADQTLAMNSAVILAPDPDRPAA